MSSKKDRAMRHTHRILPTKIGGTYGDADVRTPKPSRAERREARRAHEEIRAAILENAHAGRATFDGLSTDEIAAYNRRITVTQCWAWIADLKVAS